MILIGLTGGIACGKSTVARLLEEHGAILLDSDAIVHELYAESEFAGSVQKLFPVPVLAESGAVDRVALGKIVFADALAMRQLEKLVHPAVRQRRDEKLQVLKSSPAPAIVLEAVKLIEAGHAELCNVVWCVWCDEKIQLRRLMEKRGLSEEGARVRLASQPSLKTKRALMNDKPLTIIENNGTLDDLKARVDQEWTRVLRLDSAS